MGRGEGEGWGRRKHQERAGPEEEAGAQSQALRHGGAPWGTEAETPSDSFGAPESPCPEKSRREQQVPELARTQDRGRGGRAAVRILLLAAGGPGGIKVTGSENVLEGRSWQPRDQVLRRAHALDPSRLCVCPGGTKRQATAGSRRKPAPQDALGPSADLPPQPFSGRSVRVTASRSAWGPSSLSILSTYCV